MTELSDYEKQALGELYAWKNPRETLRGRFGDFAERALDEVIERLPTKLLESTTQMVMPVFNGAGDVLVRPEVVYWQFRRSGHGAIASLDQLADLSLENVEAVVGTKRFRELVTGGAQGGVAGYYGLIAIPADVAALTTLSMRSMALFAYSYGFDAATREERAFRLGILDATSSLGPKAKRVSVGGLSTLARQLGERQAVKRAIEATMKKLPPRLIARLTAMKVEDVVPWVSAVIAGAFNAWFLRGVAVNARFAYRERFLSRRYGPDLLEAYGL